MIAAKKEDPFDIEGIEKPFMNMIRYQELKSYLLKEITVNEEFKDENTSLL